MGYKSNDANQEPPRIFLFTTVSLSQVFLSNKKLNSTCSFPLRSTKKCVSTLCLYLTDGLPEKGRTRFYRWFVACCLSDGYHDFFVGFWWWYVLFNFSKTSPFFFQFFSVWLSKAYKIDNNFQVQRFMTFVANSLPFPFSIIKKWPVSPARRSTSSTILPTFFAHFYQHQLTDSYFS